MSRKQERQINKVLLLHEIREAEDEVVRSCQRGAFVNDYKALVSGKPMWPKSPLFKLNPVLCNLLNTCHMVYVFLRYCEDTGLQSSLLNITMNRPTIQQVLIIISTCWMVGLFIVTAQNYFVLSPISEKYWAIAAFEEIQEWEGECNMWGGRSHQHRSWMLPKIHLRFTFRPFDWTAVDYAEPFTMVQGRGLHLQKSWLCLFICLSTLAVHLEIAFGLDTDSVLNAFTRKTSWRGVPKEMISDCGTNFVGSWTRTKSSRTQLIKVWSGIAIHQ